MKPKSHNTRPTLEKTFRTTFSNSKRRRSSSSSLSDDSDSDDVARRSRCSLEKSSSATRASIVFSWLNGSRTSFSDFRSESFAFLMGGGVNRGGGVVSAAGSSGGVGAAGSGGGGGLSCSLVSVLLSALPIVRRQPRGLRARSPSSPCVHAHQGSVVLGMCQAGRASSAVAADTSPRNGAAMRNSGAAYAQYAQL